MNPNTNQLNQTLPVQNGEKRKFSPTSVALIVGTAILVDLLGFLLTITVIGPSILNMVAFCMFYIWFKLKGIKFNKLGNISVFSGTAIVEFIPLLNTLPTWTAATLWFIYKDKLLSKIPGSQTIRNFIPKK